jgi:hypothetical protein
MGFVLPRWFTVIGCDDSPGRVNSSVGTGHS